MEEATVHRVGELSEVHHPDEEAYDCDDARKQLAERIDLNKVGRRSTTTTTGESEALSAEMYDKKDTWSG